MLKSLFHWISDVSLSSAFTTDLITRVKLRREQSRFAEIHQLICQSLSPMYVIKYQSRWKLNKKVRKIESNFEAVGSVGIEYRL